MNNSSSSSISIFSCGKQEEYKKEGIDWTGVTFADNKPVLSTDHSFVEKLTQNCGKSNAFIKSKHSNTNFFGICHYAGKVEYDATGFLEKNRDTLPPGVMDMFEKK
ncbi:hypothetical protein OS493_002535 [Desmophyllum pertusum]|uniref:Myosin motor domain-containing protein n=1 Tax=Desmophyllum pertusum TaxID=174260 RepID=A0A9W9YWF6_9CNID|nr:hypothetical protein OS493_002535 [Desmophyllum pertusum]